MKALFRILLIAFFVVAARPSAASIYEQELPPELFSQPDLCKWTDCASVLPGANAFSARKGSPPYVEAYADDGHARALKGYVFLSTDIADIQGYSGKPIVTLIGMDTKGTITGVRVLKHSEPILLVGIPRASCSRSCASTSASSPARASRSATATRAPRASTRSPARPSP